jgi:orotate phosphoribosyltransferase
VLTAVDGLREEGSEEVAEVVGTVVLVDRGAGVAVRAAGQDARAALTLADLGRLV